MKIALITGGSRGLGREAAINMAKKNTAVIITYLSNEVEAQKTVDQIKTLGGVAYALKLNTAKADSFDLFVSELTNLLQTNLKTKSIDYLLNNAGIGRYSSIIETSEDTFDELMNIHLKGVFFLTQKLIPLINSGGKILNISSGLTRFSYPGYAAYAMMKGAIEVFTRYLAVELGERRVNVNCLAPGAIETDFGNGAVRDNKELNNKIAEQTPLGRVGLPTDIGPIISELLCDEMKWINGQRIEASGGIHS
ncbi:putative short-chain dehydrogenase/reductase [Halobacteriovorax marinus SJ]|uniref:Short-chain dehydrogenase/reductase n=1 Tax=Halobacteriovorax marinus (strain ATCC BAA-682 / DSM 15412 / SJ) TaxID=862908 RepID=E1WY44_HALMS|nr:SDR family oxidoreductase [Halobacteriovorax marinus]CBW27599.1 putative short-chain dehydrogenase/reductase [Halobacteriovorax marinus SJ]